MKCKICDMEFDTEEELGVHRREHEEQIEEEWRGYFQKFT